MKARKMIRTVRMTTMFNTNGYGVFDECGELDKFFPVCINATESIDRFDTVEISTEFFQHLAMLQNLGVSIVFKT